MIKKTNLPITWKQNPKLEWSPPGHGDLYSALVGSGMLEKMIRNGYEYFLISNMDNLSATFDPSILGFIIQKNIGFLMETPLRLEADKKGGHLAYNSEGKLILREVAQCDPLEINLFQDYTNHKYFNANTLWIDIKMLKKYLDNNKGVVKLPLISNKKTVNPTDANSPKVIQLETAMGSGISVFDNTKALEVPRNRFTPIKETRDLLVLRSDAYKLDSEGNLTLVVENGTTTPPLVVLDKKYYKNIKDLEARFPNGPPSLKECISLKVTGDILFEENVKCIGNVEITNGSTKQKIITKGIVLEGKIIL